MFDKILIANRGEIAVRVIRACKEMGVKTVAIYSTADAEALHVALADEAYCIGGPRPVDSYLNEDAIITVALQSGAKAIHPGYGFFSENSHFARECQQCGLVFIGPDPDVIDRMGDKDNARRTARDAGVPIVPGCDLLKSADEAVSEATRIGCPVLIKARSGGGGRGIRKVEDPADAGKAFTEAHAEAEAAFGGPRTTLRCRSWPTPTATWSPSASASAPSSAATRSSSRRARLRAWTRTPVSVSPCTRPRATSRAPWATWAWARSSSSLRMTATSTSWR